MIKKFLVKGMSCAACQAHVQKAVDALDGVTSCNVNLLTNSMVVDFNDNIDSKTIIAAVEKAGYGAEEYKKVQNKEKDLDLKYLIIAFSVLIVLMYISMGHMISLPISKQLCTVDNAILFVLVQLFLTIPILIIYRKYFISGYKKLFNKAPNMDSLIAIGASASIVYGLYSLVMIIIATINKNPQIIQRHIHNLYFESAAMILTLVSLGKYFEKKSKQRTLDALNKLMDLAPKSALVLRDGVEVNVAIDDVVVGDIVIVKKGEAIPVDGVIVEGAASIDQSNITGESIPVYKKSEDSVFSSTIITSGYIKIRAEKVGSETSIAHIIKLVEEASNSKAPISKLADKIAGIFVPIVLAIAAVVFIANFIYHKDFELAFNFAISVVVIACPCSLGLATPVAIMVGEGKGAECGLLIKNAEILEKAKNIKTVVFDKTGTITQGKPSVVDMIEYDNEALKFAYAVENISEHPLANAIVKYAIEKRIKLVKAEDYETIEGLGVSAKVEDKKIFVGNLALAHKLNVTNLDEKIYSKYADEGKIPLIVMCQDKALGIICIKDEIKESSALAIKELKRIGVESIMLTGDNKKTAQSIAKEVGIDKVYAQVLPSEKQDVVKSLLKEDGLVAMVGDGVNDALALTQADLGIAIGGESDVAVDSADIVLIRNDLMDIKNVITLSKRVFSTIKGNLFWAFFYNCIGILLASGIFYVPFNISLNPMMGSLAMSLSSVFVVVNALTINLYKPTKIEKENIVNEEIVEMEKIVINVEGMMCMHCVKHVQAALLKVEGVESATASLENKNVEVSGKNLNEDALKSAIVEAGYEVVQ